MDWLILILLLLLPPYAAFRLVLARRAGWAWALPLGAVGLGVLGVLHVETVAVSEQSRTFGSLALILLFGAMAIVLVVGCIVGHAVRRITSGMRGERGG